MSLPQQNNKRCVKPKIQKAKRLLYYCCNRMYWNKKHKRQKAKNPLIERVFLNRSLVMTYFHMANATLSSALFRFTTEFGMG
ncbi:hypothetical protein, partial [Pseudoalteromonas sp. T1lg10]|uniref:hypothetical protein n=1 Tax=Pseudoalteromonas sp. T1lg10 TaxID=2077093 RepID=UPI001F44CFFA